MLVSDFHHLVPPQAQITKLITLLEIMEIPCCSLESFHVYRPFKFFYSTERKREEKFDIRENIHFFLQLTCHQHCRLYPISLCNEQGY